MKKIIITLFFAVALKNTNAKPPIDTLQILKTKIEQQKGLFLNKPLRIMLDSLKSSGLKIIEYSGAHDSLSTLLQPDTIWVSGFNLYFEPYLYSQKVSQKIDYFRTYHIQDTTKIHLSYIQLVFDKPLAFLSSWIDTDRFGIASNTWNKKVEYFYRKGIVKDIIVDEY